MSEKHKSAYERLHEFARDVYWIFERLPNQEFSNVTERDKREFKSNMRKALRKFRKDSQ